MATHSSILAWRIPWTEELGELQSTGRKELDRTERLHFHFQVQIVNIFSSTQMKYAQQFTKYQVIKKSQ